MDDAVNLVSPDYASHLVKISYVSLHECVVWLVLNVLEISEVTGVRQLVEIDNMILLILVHEKADHMAANKPGTPGYEYVAFHFDVSFRFLMQILRESVQYGTFNSNVSLNLVLSRTE